MIETSVFAHSITYRYFNIDTDIFQGANQKRNFIQNKDQCLKKTLLRESKFSVFFDRTAIAFSVVVDSGEDDIAEYQSYHNDNNHHEPAGSHNIFGGIESNQQIAAFHGFRGDKIDCGKFFVSIAESDSPDFVTCFAGEGANNPGSCQVQAGVCS